MADWGGATATNRAWATLCTRAFRSTHPLILALVLVIGLTGCDSVEERAQQHYENGLELLEEGEAVKASLEFRNALQLNDSHPGANFELGKIYEKQKNFTAAAFQYRRSIELDATQLGAHLRLAQIMIAFNQVDEAVKSMVVAGQLAPDDVEVLTLEAVLAARLGDLERAEQTAERALEIDRNHGDAWIVLSSVAQRQGNEAVALARIEEATRRDTNNPRVILYRISFLTAVGRAEEVEGDLRRLIELDPTEIAYWDGLARWQLEHERFDEIKETLRKISDLAPNDIDRQLDIVRLVASTQGREAAIAELERLIALRRESDAIGDLEMAMVDILVETDDLEAAERRLRRILVEISEDRGVIARARSVLARLHLARQELGEARAVIGQILEREPNDPEALTLRGRILIADERYEEAIRDLRAADAERPENVETLRLLALAHERNGNRDLAGERLAAAVAASEQDPETVLAYVRHLLRDARVAAAENLLVGALAVNRGDLRLTEALARVHLRQGEFGRVEATAQRLQRDDASREMGDRLLAAAFAAQRRYDDTITVLESTAAASDNPSAYLSALVATHLRNRDLEAAREVISAALAENENDSNAVRLQATLALVENQPEIAGNLFRDAVRIAPELPINHLALFRYHLARGETEVAEAALRAGLSATDSDQIRLNLAMLYETNGRIPEAIAEYEQLYERQPGSEIVANNLASLITDSDPTPEDVERAYTIARRLRNSEVPHFRDTYGWLLHLRGSHAEALGEIEQAAAALPNNAIVHYHLGVVLAELDRTDEARTALSRAIELAKDRPVPQIAGAQALLDSLGAPGATPADLPAGAE
ncbi:MAG: tetratricopeptide repeat protein [Pikeienuella sp.]